jgi:GTP-binding protein
MSDILKKTPVIAIVGRTNVGKSTMFNKLIERRKAVVSNIPGTTQDINFGHCRWRDRIYTIIDTAGLDLSQKRKDEEKIRHQAEMAINKSDAILFLTDVGDGITVEDKAFARFLLKSKKKVFLVANKADSPSLRRIADEKEWSRLGLGEAHPASAVNGTGVGDLLDEVTAYLKDSGKDVTLPDIDARVAIIGRPNVGKSSLLNALAGEERVIVSEVAHTTKEPQDTLLTFSDRSGTEKNLLVIDTVGIRKRTHIAPGLEKLGVKLSLDVLADCDVGLLIIDAEAGISIQEKKLGGTIAELHKAMIIVVNKWDIAQEKGTDGETFMAYVHRELPFFEWAPVVLISAKSGRSVAKIPQLVLDVVRNWKQEVDADKLAEFTERIKKQHHAVSEAGYWKRRPKIYGIAQNHVKPPHFLITVDDKDKLSEGLCGFVENRLRETFNFEGTAINVGGRPIRKK